MRWAAPMKSVWSIDKFSPRRKNDVNANDRKAHGSCLGQRVMVASATITASMEDYLEAIFHIVAKKGAARAKDISKQLKVNHSSVTGALKALATRKLVNYAPYDVVTLTPQGRTVAEDVIRRHEALRDFFVKVLAIDVKVADEGACEMEHALPRPVLERLIQYIEFLEACPLAGTKWTEGLGYYCYHGATKQNCERCISTCLEDVKEKEKGEKRSMNATLRDLRPGQKARIVKIKGRGAANKRIVDMGFTPGTMIEVERVAPLGDPIDVKVRGYHLSLRKEEAGGITVEVQ